ncbi:MAG: exopolysaccharide biosynthesis polyprenyl glycosylphosphotransferase family protein [Actinomycetia bacterium]|nr:exopolysaccharide biosynthesis polyprenyl glycosylphosphotransferase family protein [Actinomycetes bacterium]
MSDYVVTASERRSGWAAARMAVWTRTYLRQSCAADTVAALLSSTIALQVRFNGHISHGYEVLSLAFPVLWVAVLLLSGSYDVRYIGTGSDEFRKVLNAGVSLTAGLAILSYAINNELSRTYLVITMPGVTLASLILRYLNRKRLHRKRARGLCMSSMVAVGHPAAVAELVKELRRDTYHGLKVVATCVPGASRDHDDVAGVRVFGGVDDVASAVVRSGADSVAVLPCNEIDAVSLRRLAWELEKTGTDLCVAPSLLDVAGPRTTIRPTAGLTLLHVDHPRLSGARQVLKGLFDRMVGLLALLLLSPLMLAFALAIRLSDQGPALFTQTRVGKEGKVFRLYKFRTMVVDAEARLAELRTRNEHDGVLFKMRRDPRITAIGAYLRKYSIDELPQLFNVVRGEMSLVGPRPALPEETALYADHVRRRLVVKPGLTGMWQVNGRSDLSWEESVRLDLRYVENWSLALDLQILWKTVAVILRGSGAY